MQFNNKFTRQKGFTLPELILGITIIGIAAIVILSTGKRLLDGQRAGSFKTYHLEVIGKVSQFYSPDFDYSAVSTDSVSSVLKDWIAGAQGSRYLKTPYSSAKGLVMPVASQTNMFAMVYNGIPSNQCADIVSALASRAIAVGVSASPITAVDLSTALVKNVQNNRELDRGALNTACDSAAATFNVYFVQQ